MVDEDVTVWTADPIVPILVYHQFKPDNVDASTVMKVRLADFRARLQVLYDSGYSLVPLEDWITGKLQVPAGRRPLILSMDDAFTNNQIKLTPEGVPSLQTGIGVLWQFSQEHPDLGFHLAVFTNINLPFDNPDNPNRDEVKAQTLVWCIEHDAMPFNHLWGHPELDLLTPDEIQKAAAHNDTYMRELLGKVNRADLADKIANIIALPFGIWPANKAGINALEDYRNPEGKPLLGVMEAMTANDFLLLNIPKYLQPPYSALFDRYHIPRFDGSPLAIDYLVKHKDDFPAAQSCTLKGMDPQQLNDANYWQEQIRTGRGNCPDGVYATNIPGMFFRVSSPNVTILHMRNN